mmetsp:Transcript_18030/g.27938  ORF Transcript_18030/g.27938 Transcript_18030/m.27938 type:complete len:92 (+) Transcript_18030:987-1262(+)
MGVVMLKGFVRTVTSRPIHLCFTSPELKGLKQSQGALVRKALWMDLSVHLLEQRVVLRAEGSQQPDLDSLRQLTPGPETPRLKPTLARSSV